MSQQEHIHKYQRVILGGRKIIMKNGKKHIEHVPGYIVFKCMLPNCNHYRPRELVCGMKSLCWRCEGEMILNMENTTLKKPTHKACRKTKEKAA